MNGDNVVLHSYSGFKTAFVLFYLSVLGESVLTWKSANLKYLLFQNFQLAYHLYIVGKYLKIRSNVRFIDSRPVNALSGACNEEQCSTLCQFGTSLV